MKQGSQASMKKLIIALLAAGTLVAFALNGEAGAQSPVVAGGGGFSAIFDSESDQITAVSSKVHNGYVRAKLPDGSFRPETYALGVGGSVSGGGARVAAPGAVRDDTIDRVTFADLARPITVALAGQNYLPTHDLGKIDILIVVYWGRTGGSVKVLGGADKDMIDARNAALLGFDLEGLLGSGLGPDFRSMLLRNIHSDLMDAIEVDRYYVVLLAIDFQSARKQKKIKLLWETRFSLSERRHDFGEELPIMTQFASQYFGQDSRGLIRKPIPEGNVHIGEVKSLGPVPEVSDSNAGEPPSKP
jgi:hypothetical protein